MKKPLAYLPQAKQDENSKLLKKAYLYARYKKDYKITKKQLEYLTKRVKMLQRLTNKICKEKIKSIVEPRFHQTDGGQVKLIYTFLY